MKNSRRIKASTVLLATCLVTVSGCVNDTVAPDCAPASSGPAATTAAITSTLDGIRKKHRLNAIIFSAEQNGQPILRTALGTSTSGVPATTDMHFRIGAVGWQYLMTVLLRVTDQSPERIALTDPVSKWYPDYPYASLATVRMLAASSAGFGEYITAPVFLHEVGANPLRAWSADELVARSVAPYQTPQFTTPGRDWDYSHTGFVMVGAMLEQASGKAYAQLLKELILDPLELRHTRLQFDAEPQLPVLHTLTEEQFQDSTYWNPSFVSWAAMTSNICDLGTWNRAFGTGSLLPPALQSEITAPVNVGLGINTAAGYFGLGTIVQNPWNVQHAAYWGMYTSTAYDPSTGISLAVTASLSRDSPPGIQPTREILAAISALLTPGHPLPK